MSLFDEASILITPNAYKEGKIYAIKPTDGSGDLSVTRATSATRVDAQGLVEIPRTNLATYSEDFTNVIWQKLNATVSGNSTTAPNGTTTADKIVENTSNAFHYLLRTISLTNSVTYKFSTYLKADGRTRGRVRIIGSSTYWDLSFNLQDGIVSGATGRTIENVGNGWYRISGTFTTNQASNDIIISLSDSTSGNSGFNYTYTGNGTSGIYIWGAQIEQGSVLTEYIPTVASIRTKFAGITQDGSSASNIPRLDYTNGSCPSILVEPQRTNLALRSEEFDNAMIWPGSAGIIRLANQGIAPNGTNTMDLITFPVAGNSLSQSVTVISGATYTFSIWLATQSGTQTVEIGNINSGVYQSVTVTTTAQRFEITQVASSTNRFPSIRATANYSILVWGAQLEVGSNATSYIPTVASTVTRNADVISKTGISSLIGQTEGTIFAQIRVSSLLGTASRYIFHLSDGTTNNRIYMAFSGASSNILRARIFNGGVLQANIESSTITTLGTYKLALAYKNNDIVFYINGVQIGTDASATIPTCSRVDLGQNFANASQFNDGISNANIWKTRLTNAELAQLTTL